MRDVIFFEVLQRVRKKAGRNDERWLRFEDWSAFKEIVKLIQIR